MKILRLIAASTLIFGAGILLDDSYHFMSDSILKFFQGAFGILICYDVIIYIFAEFIYHQKKEQSKAENTLNQPGYYYQYLNDDTGMAFNIKESKLLLYSHGKTAVYPRSAIRSFESAIFVGSYDRDRLSNILEVPIKSLHNMVGQAIIENEADQKSGFIFRLADINCPKWFVHCNNEYQLTRYGEIIRQFMEGILPIPNK